MVSRSDPMGGPYPVFCRTCHARVWDVQRANELDYIGAVRDLLAASEVSGDPIEACKAATLAAIECAWTIYADEIPAYRPHRTTPATYIEYGIKPADLKLKRAKTLLARFVAALDREIEKRSSQTP